MNEYADIARSMASGAGASPAPSVAPADDNPYRALAAGMRDEADTAARASLYGSLGAYPDRSAKAGLLGKRYGLAPDTVEADFDAIERRAVLEDRDKAVQASPKLKGWVADPFNAKVAADDLDSLAGIEQAVRAYEDANGPLDRLGQRLRSGAVTLARNADVAGAVNAGEVLTVFDAIDRGDSPRDLRTRLYGEGYERTRPRTGLDDLTDQYFGSSAEERQSLRDQYQAAFSDNLTEAAERTRTVGAIPRNPAADAFVSKADGGDWAGAFGAFATDPIGVIAQLGAESLPQAAPGMALSVAVGPVAGMGLGSLGTEYLNSLVSGLSAEGVDLNKPETLDKLRDPAVLDRVRIKAAARASIVGAFDAASGGLAGRTLLGKAASEGTKFGVKHAGRTVGDTVTGLPRRAALGAAELGAQAVAQGAIGAAGEAAAQLGTGEELQPGQIAAEFLGEFFGAPGEVASAALHGTAHGRVQEEADGARKAQQAGQDQAKLDALVASTDGSKLAQRDPEAFAGLLKAQTEGTPVENVFIPADRLVAYFQTAGIDPRALEAQMPDLMAQVSEALAVGGDVVIPAADYLSKLAPEHHAGMREDIRIGQDGFTPREAAEFEASLPGALDKATAETAASLEAEQTGAASAQRVYDDVSAQLIAAGRAPDVAAREAAVYRAFFGTMAQRAGGDAFGLYERYGLQVRRELPAALQGRDVGELDLLIERLRAKRGKGEAELFGPSLLEFVANNGGVIDEGGDLRSQDADTWHKGKAFRKKLIREDGIPLDAMAEKAWEAGYFGPVGTTERPDVNALLDAMQEELRGRPRYAEPQVDERGVDQEQAVAELDRVLNELGVDVKTAANDDIKRALNTGRIAEAAQGAVYDQGKRGKRGRIQFGDGQTIVTLFERADLSTVLHETGHLFLEVMRDLAEQADAPQQIRDDWAAALKWMGVEDGAAIGVEQHEQWARGFEAYLMEGKAPSADLQGIFDRFRAWLVTLYRSVKSLRVNVSPEIRGVFDRMLAVDDEIAAVTRQARYAPLFDSAAAAGMTEAEFSAYAKAAEGARIEAGNKLLAKALDDLRRQRETWWKEERASLRTQVAEEVSARPVYAAMIALQRGEYPDGTPFPGKVKLSRAALVEQYGEEVLKLLPRGKGYVYAREGGVHPDVAAELFGFGSGDEMVKAILNAQPLRAVVDAETDRQMADLHGDLLNDGRLHEEALALLRNEMRGKVLATELRALRRLGGDAALRRAAERSVQMEGGKDAEAYRAEADTAAERTAIQTEANASPETRDVALMGEAMADARGQAAVGQRRAQAAAVRQTREATAVDVEAIHAAAKRLISDKPVKEATAFGRYMAAEVRAAKRVEQAIAARDYQAAAKAKEQQLLAHYMALESKRAADEVDGILERFRRLRKSDEKLSKGTDIDYVYAARALLTRHGLDFSRFDLPGWAERLRREDPDAAGRLSLAMEAALAPLPLPHRDMLLNDFRSLNDAVANLLQVGISTKTIEVDGRKVELATAVQEMAAQVGDRDTGARPGETSAVTEADKLKVGLLGWRAALMRVETWARWMDGGKSDGPFTRYLVRPVMDAANAYRDAKRARLEQLLTIIEPRKAELLGAKVAAPELGYTFANKGELLHAIAHTGNESNMAKLLEGRKWSPAGWNALIGRLAGEGVLTKADFDMVQALWDLNEDMKGEAQKAHKKLYGYRFAEITARPVQTPFGEYKGGYMPAIVDRMQVDEGNARADADALKSQQNASMFPSTGRGFTKSRVENYTKPLELNLMLIPSHIDAVLKFSHLQPVIQQGGRFAINREFRGVMHGVDPTVVSDMLAPWLQRTARQTVETPAVGAAGRLADKFWRTLRKRAGLQAMVGNVLNAAQQITGFSSAAVRVSPGRLGRALVAVAKGGASEEIERKSSFMRNRMSAGSLDLMQRAEDILTDVTSLDKVRRFGEKHGYFLQAGFQNFTDRVVWLAAYEQATEQGKSDADAVFEADAVVRQTQGSFAPEDVSRFETGPAFMRMFSMFYSYFNAQANLVGGDAAVILQEAGWRGGMGRLAYLYVFGMMIPAVLAEAIVRGAKGDLGDDEDDGLGDDLASLFFGAQARYVAGMVPIAGPVTIAAVNAWNSLPYDDRLSTSPVASTLETTVRAPVSVWKALAEDGSAGKAVRDSLTALGVLSGLPLGQLGKPLGYAADVASGDAAPEGLGDVLSGILTGRQPKPH